MAALIATAAWLPAGIGATPPARDNRPLAVEVSTDHYPYSFVEHGELQGFAVDVLDAVGRVMDLHWRRVPTRSPEAAPPPSVDPGISVEQLVTQAPEAREHVDVSVPYLTLQGAVFVRAGEPRFHTGEELRKAARIGTGIAGYNYALRHGFRSEQFVLLSAEECLRQLAAGRLDAVMLSRLTGLSTLHRVGLQGVEARAGMTDDFVLHFCFGVRRGDQRLLDQLNEGLAILFQTGEYERIYRKWFRRFEPPGFTREQVVGYVAAALATALVVTFWALVRQRQLRRRIARQAAELAESRTFLAEAQRFAQLGHWQGTLLDPRRTVWSDEMYRIFGRDRALGPPAHLNELLSYVVPAHRERWRELIERLINKGQPYSVDLDLDGPPPERRTIHVRARVVSQPDHGAGDIFGTVQDVTATRIAATALHESEELLRALYDNLPHALGVVERRNADWLVVALNPEAQRLFGRDPTTSLPQPLRALHLPAETEREWRERFERCAAANGPVKIESGKGDRHFVTTLVPLGHPAQHLRCCFLVEDVSERRRQDAEIAQGRRLRALGELVGGIAHEFNNLLTPILIKADQLRAEWSRYPNLQEDLQLIVATARRSADLTRRLLAFGRQVDRRVEVFSLATVVASDIELLRHTIDRRIEITSGLPADLPPLFLCANDVHQILLNLLLNARDTLTEKLGRPRPSNWRPTIRIEASRAPAGSVVPLAATSLPPPREWIVLAVRDNGLGMSANVLERIFEPFYTTKEVGQGTGLGLATAWHLTSELGGRLEVESVLGEGSMFQLSLPVLSPPAKPPADQAAAPQTGTDRALRILLVDDEPAIARLLVGVLQRSGQIVTVLHNGHDAWARLASAPQDFDALVVDLNMPGMTGLELVRRARTLRFRGPILVMSGRVTDDENIELAALDVAILHKPFTAEKFLAAFQAHVRAATRCHEMRRRQNDRNQS
jgi:two-component system, cell cycle sensor histidine kinase and response regulator CckA